MTKTDITTLEVARCLSLLEAAKEPIAAADIARRLGLYGCRETRRRHVRAIVKRLRDNGSMIVATLQDGYFLTEDMQLWQDYLSGRQIDAKRVLGETHRRKKMVADGGGQGTLFDMRIRCGVATCGGGW